MKINKIIFMFALILSKSIYADVTFPTIDKLYFSEFGFSIVIPPKWEVETKKNSVLFYAPNNVKSYFRSIKVTRIRKPTYIDSVAAKQFEKFIMLKFKYVKNINTYKLRNYLITQLKDGRPAILYYTQFKYNKTDMMHAHLVISNSTESYLITFTDVAGNFEDQQSPNLQEAWDAITSISIKGSTPERFNHQRKILLIFMLILIVLLFYLSLKSNPNHDDKINYINDDLSMESFEDSMLHNSSIKWNLDSKADSYNNQ